jgi:hypothetical protein
VKDVVIYPMYNSILNICTSNIQHVKNVGAEMLIKIISTTLKRMCCVAIQSGIDDGVDLVSYLIFIIGITKFYF